MRMKNSLLIACLASLLAACSSTPSDTGSQSASMSIHKGFSIGIPADYGWRVVKDSDYKVEMAKPGLENYERYTLQALVVSLPKFQSDADFMTYIQGQMGKGGGKVLQEEINFISGGYSLCVQYNSMAEDKSVKGKIGADRTMMLEMVNFTCRHPYRDGAGIYLAYAKRYYAGNADADLTNQALNVFRTLEFSDL